MRAGLVSRCARGQDEREWNRELVQELRVGRDEMEGYGPRCAVRDDPVREVAAFRMLLATAAPTIPVVVGDRRADLEVALEGGPKVGTP